MSHRDIPVELNINKTGKNIIIVCAIVSLIVAVIVLVNGRKSILPPEGPLIALGPPIPVGQADQIDLNIPQARMNIKPHSAELSHNDKFTCEAILTFANETPKPTFVYFVMQLRGSDFVHEPFEVEKGDGSEYLLKGNFRAPVQSGIYDVLARLCYIIEDSDSRSSNRYIDIPGPKIEVVQ